MAVVDLDAESDSYGRIIGQTDLAIGDELHHFGWNACSSCLCPHAPHPHIQRRYLIVPGIRSSRLHVLDTPRRWNITVDGHELAHEVLFVEVLNTHYIGPALPIGPSSAPGDRLLDVVYLLPEKRDEMLSWLENPERIASPFLVRQGRKIILQWENGHLHIDDRAWMPPEKPTPVKIKLEQKKLNVCVPPPLAS
jgi:selenium-binding protein 1